MSAIPSMLNETSTISRTIEPNDRKTVSFIAHGADSTETIVYQDAHVYVSTQRLIVGIKTFDLADVKKAHMRSLGTRRWPMMLMLIGGIIAAVLCFVWSSLVAGLTSGALFLCTLGLRYAIRPNYVLQIVTAQGPTDVLMSLNHGYVARAYDALNEVLQRRTI